MILTPMRYKDYTWPHNPVVYSIRYEHHLQATPVLEGYDYLAWTGLGHRVMRGEGEFVGAGAYKEFKKLASVFYEKSAGLLIHPVWQTAQAYFAELTLEQEPRADYVRYSFVFWEDLVEHDTALSNVDSGTTEIAQSESAQARKTHTVVKGDTLYSIARQYGLTLNELITLNPQIKNIHMIYVGDIIYLS